MYLFKGFVPVNGCKKKEKTEKVWEGGKPKKKENK